MTRIGYIAAGLLSAYLGFTQYVTPVFADAAPNIQTKVSQPFPGLESYLESGTLNNGCYNGRYRAEGEVIIKNNGNEIPGSLTLMYSLCFLDEDGRSGCKDGKIEELAAGLPQGELRRQFRFRERFKDDNPRKGKPKISVSLMKKKNLFTKFIILFLLPQRTNVKITVRRIKYFSSKLL